MLTKKNKSLSSRLSIILIIGVFTMSVISTLILYNINRNATLVEFEVSNNKTINQLAKNIALPLWDIHEVAMNSIGKNVSQDDSVLFLDIRNDDDISVFTYKNPKISEYETSIKKLDIIHNGRKIGAITIKFTEHYLNKKLNNMLYSNLLSLLLTLITIIILIFFIFKKLLRNPINQLIEKSIAIGNGSDTNNQENSYTEFLPVINILNKMNKKIIGQMSELTKHKESLEVTVQERTMELESINKRTIESIEYASIIQKAIIPSNDIFSKYFSDHFIVWQPKDIVGGDIYLCDELRNDDECLLFVIDCTGHGVSGAFVTMLIRSIERQIVYMIKENNDEVNTAEILKIFNKEMKTTLRQDDEDSKSNVGFDGGIIYFNKEKNIIRYSGAYTPLYYIENDELKILKGDRYSVGYKTCDINYEYTQSEISIHKGMRLFISTDGYIDQLGGEKQFPYGKKKFKNSMITSNISFEEQKDIFINNLKQYQGNESRTDDLTLLGICI